MPRKPPGYDQQEGAMQLILVRHGHAVSEEADPLRPLSEAGREEARKTAALLQARGFSAAVIYHSQKERARETARILKDIFCPQARLEEKEGLAPNDRTEPLAGRINQETENICVVGHLPFVSCLVSRLVTGCDNKTLVHFRTGTAAVLEKSAAGQWDIHSVVQP
ncbi:MAG: phosphohistidine phosphatase SixA [Candidatus Omnitrophota bacterium]